jgi:Cu2+-exporting ATPase
MVGDGLNDTAALARAHAAMAPGAALDASQNSADLVFSGERLGAVAEAIDVARSARTRALENFAFAAAYNLVAAPAAILGLVNPFLAALAMSGSSLIVTLNALRLRVERWAKV